MLRIGYGFDAHRLVPERKLILCGVGIPHATGLLGHSDADVALHAVADALLGALALGDIGQWFPDSDEKYRNADSMELLNAIIRSPRTGRWKLHNLDLTITAQKPKLAPYRETMRANLAAAFGVPVERISVKATTTEKMGYEGREEGISAACVLLADVTENE